MGAQKDEGVPKPPSNLSLVLGQDKIHVVVLKKEDTFQRSKILESILSLASLRTSSNQLYLAAPRLLGAIIDAEIFRTHGIGLILFDDRRIDETIPPQLAHIPQREISAVGADASVMAELVALRSMYQEIEKNLSGLREEMKNLQTTVTSNSNLPVPPQGHQSTPSEPFYPNQDNRLPSFFNNNPWLDVLSRRGREGEPVAG
jgi:hypothetical protein